MKTRLLDSCTSSFNTTTAAHKIELLLLSIRQSKPKDASLTTMDDKKVANAYV